MKTDKELEQIALSLYNVPKNKEGGERTIPAGHGYPFGFRKFFKAFKVGYIAASKFQQDSGEVEKVGDDVKSVCCECGDKNPIYNANGKQYCLSCKPF